MRKYIFLSILNLAFFFANGQTSAYPYSEGHRMDSLRIDSLRKILPKLKGSARVDCLNLLCENYWHILPTAGFLSNRDSANLYNAKAYEEAKKINYKNGIARSLLLKPDYKGDKIVEALKLGQEINDSYVLGSSYYLMGTTMTDGNDDSKRFECFNKAIEYFQKAGDVQNEAMATTKLSNGYIEKGDYNNAFTYWVRSVELSKQLRHILSDRCYYQIQYSFINGSELYKKVGDYRTSLDYLLQANKFAKEQRLEWGAESRLIELYTLMGNYDSALHYLEIYKIKFPDMITAYNMWKGEIYLSTGEYKKAIPLFEKSIDMTKKNNPSYHGHLAKNMIGLAKGYLLSNEYQKAYNVAQEGLMLAQKTKWREYITEGYCILSEIYFGLNKSDSAYLYLKNYMSLKDSAQNTHFLWRLNEQLNNFKQAIENEKRTSQLEILNKDNQLKEQKLKQQATLRNSLIIGFLLLLLLGVFITRNLLFKRKNDKLRMQKDFELERLESEKKQAELHQKAIELEMQALRAQMNPHFIFNCLSSINRFIFKNDNKTASDYLTRFSRLIRMVLMHSQKKLIPLEDELEMIRLYLDLERLRFKDAFDYSITTTNIVDAGNIFIPPLLFQPFCENAVWHGLMHLPAVRHGKEEKGHLNIILSEVINEGDKTLHCVIEDDGVGREKAAELKSKSAEHEKSMGLKITTERLALLNNENNFSTFYKIEDILNENNEVAGTRVQLKIKYKESVEELV